MDEFPKASSQEHQAGQEAARETRRKMKYLSREAFEAPAHWIPQSNKEDVHYYTWSTLRHKLGGRDASTIANFMTNRVPTFKLLAKNSWLWRKSKNSTHTKGLERRRQKHVAWHKQTKSLGWKPKVSLEEGLEKTYKWIEMKANEDLKNPHSTSRDWKPSTRNLLQSQNIRSVWKYKIQLDESDLEDRNNTRDFIHLKE